MKRSNTSQLSRTYFIASSRQRTVALACDSHDIGWFFVPPSYVYTNNGGNSRVNDLHLGKVRVLPLLYPYSVCNTAEFVLIGLHKQKDLCSQGIKGVPRGTVIQ